MHGDFSRLTYDPLQRFSAVLSLQGRVHVDADANEQLAILHHYLRTLATDLLGEASFPTAAPGFEITAMPSGGGTLEDLGIGIGRAYLDGLLVENPEIGSVDVSFYRQPDAFFDPDDDPLPDDGPFFVYLQVSERLVTWVEDPSIRDVALGAGGPDSAARAKVVWQVRCHEPELTGSRPGTAAAAKKLWSESARADVVDGPTGRLTARDQPTSDDELCALAPGAGYRGLENQLYRVEVHGSGALGQEAGPGPPTFKWSRDNGSVVFPIDPPMNGKLVRLATLGRDDRFQIDVGDWVEIVDDARALGGPPEDLHRIEEIDPDELRVTLDEAPGAVTGSDGTRHPFLRRWDQQERSDLKLGTDHAITAELDAWIALEDGLEIRFGAGTYRSGDYWLIPARVETGKIEWPRENDEPAPAEPYGVRYHYAPLAYVTGLQGPTIFDLRV